MRFLREPIVLLALSALLAGLVFLGLQAPPALPATVPADQFSAARAARILETVYDGQNAHVAGTQENSRVRERISKHLDGLGYILEIQQLDHCNPVFGLCSPVSNVVARLPGKSPDDALMLTAHYDSVEAGPGIGDDAAGVAALLEIATMAVQRGGFNQDLIFLFTDAEEQGLVGAHAFASKHPWFDDVRAVINLEARGVTGASNMFETGEGNRSFIRMMAKSLQRPVANSLSREVYRRMPNDTDYSVYRDRGVSGFNFAFSGGAAVYHSAIDDFQRLDSNSMQHHGQNAWSLLQALDERDVARIETRENAVYIDLFGRVLLHYPETSATGLALVLAVLLLVFVRMTYAREIRLRQTAWAMLVCVALLLLVPALGWLLSWPLGHWIDLNQLGHPVPWPGRVALMAVAVLGVRLVFRTIYLHASTGSTTLASWMVIAILTLLLSTQLPSASFMGIVPMVAFLLGSVVDGIFWKRRTRLVFARLFGFLACAYIGLYFMYSLEVVASFEYAMWLVAPLVLPAIAVLPLLVDRHVPEVSTVRAVAWIVVALMGICVVQQFLPAHTIDRPRTMNLVYFESESTSEPLWLLETGASPADSAYADRKGFSDRSLNRAGRPRASFLSMKAEPLSLAKPEVINLVTETGEKNVEYHVDLLVPDDLRQLVLYLPATLDFTAASINGVPALDRSLRTDKSRSTQAIVVNRPPGGNMAVVLTGSARGGPKVQHELSFKARYGLPEEALSPVLQSWPLNAQANRFGHRAEYEFSFKFEH